MQSPMKWSFGLVLLACVVVGHASDEPVASTKYGSYRGAVEKTYRGRTFYSFKGIRYAAPPVGSLRFKEPQIPSVHEGIIDALKDGEDCPQPNRVYNSYMIPPDPKQIVGQEDCLFLNVYTPEVVNEAKYPVMVFIHGGAYFLGAGSSILQGPQILLNKDIVYVAFNYRLGPLGFMTTGDDVLPANLGLKDQLAALQWVKDNIKNFGGNPDSVTIFGESAGAASVNLHMHSPLSKGLFHRAISESGTSKNPWAVIPAKFPPQHAARLAKAVGCDFKGDALVSCLRSKSFEEIVAAAELFYESPTDSAFVFRPTPEKPGKKAFITEKSLAKGSNVPWMTGVTSAEGFVVFELLELGKDEIIDVSFLENNYKREFDKYFMYSETTDNPDQIGETLKQYYFKGEPITLDNIQTFVDAASDMMFNHGTYLECLAHKGPVYLYYLTHRPQRSFIQFNKLGPYIQGVPHGDDLQFLMVMHKPPSGTVYNDEDTQVMDRMIEYWTNFATYGTPTVKSSEDQWPAAKNCQNYVELKPGDFTTGKQLFNTEKMSYINSLLKINPENKSKDEL